MAAAEAREALRQSLEERQREFRAAFQELKQAARSYADPRDAIREHPLRAFAVALLVGAWLGRRT